MMYDFCWTARSIVYIRKNEKSPQIKIDIEHALEILKNCIKWND